MHRCLSLSISLLLAIPAFADTGMNPLAHDARAEAMAGACLTCDDGVPGTMSNPATLGLMREGHRSDYGLSLYSPGYVRSEGGNDYASRRNQLWFPSLGWASRKEGFSYGAGIFRQGGIASYYRGPNPQWPERAEIHAGRLVAPFAVQVSERLILGGSIGFAWLEMDLQWLLPGTEADAMLRGVGSTGTLSHTMGDSLNAMSSAGVLQASGSGAGPLNQVYLDYYNSDQFAGGASGTGHGGFFGALYQLDALTRLGFFYHARTPYSTLYGDQATLNLDLNMDDNYIAGTWDGVTPGGEAGTFSPVQVALAGRIRLREFQWPAQHGMGLSHDAGSWQIHGSIRHIAWSEVMEALRMEFVADQLLAGPGDNLVGQQLRLKWWQKWRDQRVYAIGGAVSAWPGGSIRAGYSYATNPIPDNRLHPLFAAITRHHYTLGLSVQPWRRTQLDLALHVFEGPARVNATTSPVTKVSQSGRGAVLSFIHYY